MNFESGKGVSMGKVLFINGNVFGHINPTLPLVKELITRGEEVIYISTDEYKDRIEDMGAIFISYGEEFNSFLKEYRPTGNHPFFTLIEFLLRMLECTVPIILNKVDGIKIDYIIHDSMFGGGKYVAKKLQLPAICSCTTFATNTLPVPPFMLEPGFHPQLDYIYEKLEQLKIQWSDSTIDINNLFFETEELNLVYTSRLFQPEAEKFSETYKFVGPSIKEEEKTYDFSFPNLENKKIIYISLGTINNNYLTFYKNCIKAFQETDYNVIMSVGNKINIDELGTIPDNFIVKNFVPQVAVLKKADAFISHGGLNSVSEALFHQVPVVAIPLMNDQPAVTKQLTSLGAGIGLKMDDITPNILQDSVNQLINLAEYKLACKQIGDSFMEAGGQKEAANCILTYITRNQFK
ncbi:MAG: glycosyltransferase, family [Anaerocolumna sp.]|nr:glycosyltransferase, family [Anaerocolumna sp.]